MHREGVKDAKSLEYAIQTVFFIFCVFGDGFGRDDMYFVVFE